MTNTTDKLDITYMINTTPEKDVDTLTGTGGSGLTLTRPADSLKENGFPIEETAADKTPIYTYEGRINDVMKKYFDKNRNTKIVVEMTAIGPDDQEKTIRDEITIVKRDFFMLD